ncbi:MAG: carboxynorspermidine decarboxylase, partial [Muribaculum sp.]|nr:carboxynorspermidine decarboxylase [Muribaculum sp.]
MTIDQLPTPFYIVYEDRLRKNLELICRVKREAGVDIIMAFKANALWRTFPIIGEYVRNSTASSLNEMMLANEYLGGDVHSYCPAYTDKTIDKFLEGSTHITFNSLSQFERYYPAVKAYNDAKHGHKVSAGLRVNPQCSVIETDIYNPALPGSRFGVTADMLPDILPDCLDGFHFHALCESSSYDL